MSPSPPINHQRARQLFEQALEHPPQERHAFLQRAAGDDESLRAHVGKLLAAATTHHDFLERPADVRAALPAAESYVGRRVGAYTLTKLLGWGGMGRVYEAKQEHPRRTVALKIIGSLPTPEAIRRFRYECEVLSRLQHPGIAQLYDAFAHPDPLTGEQLPCFAMELIPGAMPIHQHADERSLSTHDRVQLMIAACEALHHAHQRGVIHRDIKPGNLLVSADGVLKVIDFGIARAADAEHAATQARMTYSGQLMGTLSYMSPEQAGGDARDVDLRTDVYSLGVVLYELLSGKKPYDVETASALEAARIIREKAPTRLKLPVQGHGAADLEAIALKALAKRPADRYQSAAELARDLECWLAGEPITARPPSAVRQILHIARRHRTAAFFSLLLTGFLLAGFVGLTLGLVRINVARADATSARLTADQRARSAQQTADFLIRVLAAGNPLQPGDLAPMLQPQSVGPLETIAPELTSARDRGITANDLLRVAARNVAAALPGDPLARARVQVSLGQILVNCGLLAEAGPILAEAHTTFRSILGPSALETAQAAEWLATYHGSFVVNDGVIALRQEALDARRRLAPDSPETIRATFWLAMAMAQNTQSDQSEQGITLQRDNLQHASRVAGRLSPLALEQRVGQVLVLGAAKRWSQSIQTADSTLRDLAEATRDQTGLAALVHRHAAVAHRAQGQLQQATFHGALALQLAQRHFGGEAVAGLEHFETELMFCYVAQRRWADAARVLERQVLTFQTIHGPEHHATLKSEGRLGFLLLREGADIERARSILQHAALHTRPLEGELWRVHWYETFLAEAERRLGRPDRALQIIEQVRRQRPNVTQDHLAAQLTLIESWTRQDLGQMDAAHALRVRAREELVRLGANSSRSLAFDATDAQQTKP